MIHFQATYRPIALIAAPEIPTEWLWGFGILFAGIGLVYFLIIFVMRNRLSRKNAEVRARKSELAPMISNFLFYNPDLEPEGRAEYIRMKIDIRELLKTDFNRRVLSEVLMDLRSDVSGSARETLLALYQNLGLDADAYVKLKSWRWEKVSQGIHELTEMQVDTSYTFIRKFINDKRSVIRKQAQLATVTLRAEGISYFMDTARYRISEWQQLKLIEILRQREDFDPPRFRAWLTSENRDVVLFALRLIRHYRQNDAAQALLTLLKHRNADIRLAAVECLREFRVVEAREPLQMMFRKSGEELKLVILDTLSLIGLPDDLPFLKRIAEKDLNFIVRSKAKAVMNTLEPDCALPDTDLEDAVGEAISEEMTITDVPAEETPASMPLEMKDEAAAPSMEDIQEIVVEVEEVRVPEPEFKAEVETPVAQLPVTFEMILNRTEQESSEHSSAAEPVSLYPADADQAVSIPMDEWDEALFDFCLRQELDDILSQAGVGASSSTNEEADFLPFVVEFPTQDTEAKEDVIAENEVPGTACNPDNRTEPQEEKDALETIDCSFLPFVVDNPPAITERTEQAPKPLNTGASDAVAVEVEDTGLLEPAFGLQGTPEIRKAQAAPFFQSTLDVTPGKLDTFSIFAEFFREYDTESKRILLKEIPAVGGVKELRFLRSLLQDSDLSIREAATQAIGELTARLQKDAEKPGSDHPASRPLPGVGFVPDLDAMSEAPERPVASRAIRLLNRWGLWTPKNTAGNHE